eukprot:382683_1
MPSLNVNEALLLSSIAVTITFILFFHSIHIKTSNHLSPKLQKALNTPTNPKQTPYTQPFQNKNNIHIIHHPDTTNSSSFSSPSHNRAFIEQHENTSKYTNTAYNNKQTYPTPPTPTQTPISPPTP